MACSLTRRDASAFTARRQGRLATVVLLAGLLANVASAQACDAGRVARAHRDPSRAVRPPLLVGDSTTILAVPHLARLGIEADAHGCRQLAAGVAILAARRRAGTLPLVVVLALGSNGAIGDGAIAHALRVVGPGRVLGLVTPRRVGSGSDGALRRAAARHPDRVVLIDWLRFSRGHGSWFAGDGLHVGDAGARAFAGLVRHRLAPFFPPRALRLPRGAAPARSCGRVLHGGRGLEVVVVRGARRILCARARRLVRARPLATPGIAGWRYYDWARSGRRPWTAVYVRRDRRVVVATIRAASRRTSA
jgi:hypothetical protein